MKSKKADFVFAAIVCALVALVIAAIALGWGRSAFLSREALSQEAAQVKPGLQRGKVERLLGVGRLTGANNVCGRCPPRKEERIYFSRIYFFSPPGLLLSKDYLIVCYTGDLVCDTTQGLQDVIDPWQNL